MIEEDMAEAFPIENHAGLSPEDFAQVARAVASHSSIKHALDWLVAHNPPLVPSAMVTQDEFSHDILVACPGETWLVYSIRRNSCLKLDHGGA
jgi:hypothetical protein